MVKSFVALVAEVGFVEEPREGIAAVVMVVFFDETNDLVRLWPAEDDHMRWIDGHDFDLVPGQGRSETSVAREDRKVLRERPLAGEVLWPSVLERGSHPLRFL